MIYNIQQQQHYLLARRLAKIIIDRQIRIFQNSFHVAVGHRAKNKVLYCLVSS